MTLRPPTPSRPPAPRLVRSRPAGPASLQRRLDQAEATIKALLADKVDAVLDQASTSAVMLRGAQQELRLLNERLGRSEAYFRSLIENVTDLITVLEADGTIRYISPSVRRLLGFDPSDRMGHEAFDLVHPDDAPGVRAFMADAVACGVSGAMVSYRHQHRDGSWRQFESTGLNLLTDDAVRGIVVTSRDVTERLEMEGRYRSLFENMAAAFAHCRLLYVEGTPTDFVYLEVNRAFERQTGLRDVVGKRVTDVIPGFRRDNAEFLALCGRIASGGRPAQHEVYVPGLQRWFAISVYAAAPLHFIAVFDDVTGRKDDHEKLRQSETLNRSLVEHLPQRIFVKDVNCNYLFCNAVYARDLGIAPSQIAGKDDFAFFSKELAERYRVEDRRVMTDGKVISLDERYTVSGQERWIHIVKVPYRDADGETIGVLGLFEDISERKRLEAQRERLAALVDASPDFISYSDPATTRINYINGGGRKMCGIGKDEEVGTLKVGDLHPAWMNQRLAEVILPAAIRDGSWQGDGAFLRRDGCEIPVSMYLLAHRGADGEVDFLYTVSRDMSERNRAAEALRMAEERVRFALEAADVGIWDMDYATGVNRWSERLEAHCGLEPGTFGGSLEAFVDRIHPEDRASVLKTMEKAMKAGTDFSMEYRTIWPDGRVRWLSGAGRVVLGEHGEPIRGVGISLDVTERRTLEAQFQQAQKMEAIGRLAGGVAHDFNNLLTVILGFCELLLDDGDPRKPRDPREADIAAIQNAGMRAAGLTRQLLAFSRKEIIQPTLLDLNVLVADMRPMLERLIGEDVKVVMSLGPELASVKADRGQVEQVVMNLAVNARDAMPKGGTLTLKTANVQFDEHYAETHVAIKPGSYVALTVTDTGTGMTPEVQSRMFEPFFTTKEAGKGTGLGMATVYGIVTASGGRVDVHSEVGMGTSFEVYFPAAPAAEGLVVAPPPVNRRRADRRTVLLVEDADGVRELTNRLLQRLGYTVLVAANADEALRLFQQHPSIDLLLTDVVMPGASGPELSSRLVQERRALRVVYMSGYTDDAIVQHGVLKPGIAFLHKPFTAETLGQKIREELDR